MTSLANASFAFRLNGRVVSAEASGAQQTLLDYLRGAGLTAANEGYAEGECGACAVALVKQNGSGSEYRAVNSCLMLLPMTAGQETYTVESLADCRPGASARLHPVQARNGVIVRRDS